MQLEEYPMYAEKLMESWSAWHHASDGTPNTSTHWKRYREIFIFLEQHGLLSDRSFAVASNFVLRQAIHGSPILLTVGGEIVFKSLDFARACREHCKKYASYDDVHILMVCA